MTYNVTAVVKDQDRRMGTRGGGSIRVETWVNPKTGHVVEFNLAYINYQIFTGDNGRVVGFDNRDYYQEFQSADHYHWFGRVFHNTKYADFDAASERFQRFLLRLRQHYKKVY